MKLKNFFIGVADNYRFTQPAMMIIILHLFIPLIPAMDLSKATQRIVAIFIFIATVYFAFAQLGNMYKEIEDKNVPT